MSFPTEAEYLQQASGALEIVEKYARDKLSRFPHHDFSSPSHTEEVKIFSGPPTDFEGAKENMLKMNTILKVTVDKLFDKMVPFKGLRKQWDDQIEQQKVLQQIGDDVFIVHTVFKHRGFLPARDSVIIYKVKRSETEALVAGTSTTHPDAPPSPQVIRANVHFVGYRLKNAGANYTKLRIYWCADLNLPSHAPADFKHSLLNEFVRKLIAAGIPSINPNPVNYHP
ncbi:unnamed protein product [Bursaphelenchus xylophilus]|uniref:(pine wood nematode) hypothetical protein n=1 Tax=Bursaphelenchus xylophilus TaxID=6326 RepID=A0A1I7SRG9_BURXY|nr:unnamed protein product [Bursaphelenchus xylophilus]CAG9102416.1 unnamed protein product [Bursaphelenchus xylophilus]